MPTMPSTSIEMEHASHPTPLARERNAAHPLPRTDAETAMSLASPTLVQLAATEPHYVSHPLTTDRPRNVTAPRAGELHVWRFRCEWLPVPVQEGDTWLSKSERERARLHRNAALRRRFVSARVVVRWIVANLFNCAPPDVEFQDDGGEKLHARHPHDGRGIVIDIAYGGIWIVIGMAATTLGLSVVVPSPGARSDRGDEDARRHARFSSLCRALRYTPNDFDADGLHGDAALNAFDLAQHGSWHVLDLPMAGKIRAAVALAQPVTCVQTFGWPKALAFGASKPVS